MRAAEHFRDYVDYVDIPEIDPGNGVYIAAKKRSRSGKTKYHRKRSSAQKLDFTNRQRGW